MRLDLYLGRRRNPCMEAKLKTDRREDHVGPLSETTGYFRGRKDLLRGAGEGCHLELMTFHLRECR
jgi:hypothetical protein